MDEDGFHGLITRAGQEIVEETKTQNDYEINIQKIKTAQYLQGVEVFSGLLSDESIPLDEQEIFDEETYENLNTLPIKLAERMKNFVLDICSYISEEQLAANMPTNTRLIASLVAAIYLKKKQEGEDVDQEMFSRSLFFLKTGVYKAESPNSKIGSTEGAKEKFDTVNPDNSDSFYKSWTNKGMIGNVILNTIMASMPICDAEYIEISGVVITDNRNKLETQYEEYQKKVLADCKIYQDALEAKIREYYPNKKLLNRLQPPIFVSGLKGSALDSNISQVSDNKLGREQIHDGIYVGVDEATGLPLSFVSLSISQMQNAVTSDNNNVYKDHIHAASGTSLHEFIHSQSPDTDPNLKPFERFILEMLTESGRQIVQLHAHNQSFLEAKKGETFSGSYLRLVRAAQDLAVSQIVHESEIFKYALDQDVKSFLDVLTSNMTEGKARSLIMILQKNDLILPFKSIRLEEKIRLLIENPSFFLETEIIEAAKKFGVDTPFHEIMIFEEVDTLNPQVLYANREVWALKMKCKPEDINIKSLFLLRNPESYAYIDEVVDVYAEKVAKGWSGNKKNLDVLDIISALQTDSNSSELDGLEKENIVQLVFQTNKLMAKYMDIGYLSNDRKILTQLLIAQSSKIFTFTRNLFKAHLAQDEDLNALVLEYIMRIADIQLSNGVLTYKHAEDISNEVLARTSIYIKSLLINEDLNRANLYKILYYRNSMNISVSSIDEETKKILDDLGKF